MHTMGMPAKNMTALRITALKITAHGAMAFAAAVALLTVAMPAPATVFWLDDRVPYVNAADEERKELLDAAGAIECADGTVGTGFLVDISKYVIGAPRLRLVATSAKVLYRGDAGETREPCAFRPVAAPGQYLRIIDRILGSQVNFFMDRDDWAFATIEADDISLPRALKLRFAAADAVDTPHEKLWTAGYMAATDTIAVASDCGSYVSEAAARSELTRRDISHVIIHSCDAMENARGGPVAIRNGDQFEVIAIHTGSSYDGRGRDKQGIPFDPQRDFFNHSRRLDMELENKLVAFLSRYAELRSPSEGVKARRLLILSVQQRLKALGFDAGPLDGLLGFKTIEAVRAFQTTLGISPTGRVSEELLLLLDNRR